MGWVGYLDYPALHFVCFLFKGCSFLCCLQSRRLRLVGLQGRLFRRRQRRRCHFFLRRLDLACGIRHILVHLGLVARLLRAEPLQLNQLLLLAKHGVVSTHPERLRVIGCGGLLVFLRLIHSRVSHGGQARLFPFVG